MQLPPCLMHVPPNRNSVRAILFRWKTIVWMAFTIHSKVALKSRNILVELDCILTILGLQGLILTGPMEKQMGLFPC